LNKNPFDAVVWSNRAAVRLKLEEYGLGIADASEFLPLALIDRWELTKSAARAIELDPKFVKAYFRRASANLAIMKPKAALVDLNKVSPNPTIPRLLTDKLDVQVLQLDPKNVVGKAQLDATTKLLRRLQFEAAISSKDDIPTSVNVTNQLASGIAPIEASYAGPRLTEGKPTVDFVNELIDWFKDGNIIPRRLAWEICLGAQGVLASEPTLVDVSIPVGETINV
jgi:serine/threonine-protein phosphatase 5